ncbi:MAG TPA: SLBB domain-containing protein [Rhodothermales bacterium]|nr:SLBB domain-containing protein [Rhodothermales bacterium]
MPRLARAFSSLVLVAVCLVAILAEAPHAQIPPTGSQLPVGIPTGQALRMGRPTTTAVVLEGAVDPTTYLVGPGDEFIISIGGLVPRQVATTVSADGFLVIPEAGSFNVVGRTLASVRAEASAALRRRFANVTTDVALAVPRQFYVHVSGGVPDPGRHVVRSVARVEDALAAANGNTSPRSLAAYAAVATQQAQWPALRNIVVAHMDGSSERMDLVRYFSTGDVAYNPYLRDGDAVHVPTFSPTQEGVSVNGAVAQPGVYDIRPTDSVLDLLIASGWQRDGGVPLSAIRLMRTEDQSAPRLLSIDEASRTTVRPRDQIYAVAANPDAGFVAVAGAVHYPGAYPIQERQTTLSQLIEMAGGLRDDALLRGAYLLRPARLAADSVDTLRAAPIGDLDYFSRRFLVEQLARTPTVAIRLDRVVAGEEDLLLQNGDRLVVPRGADGVRVFGQVLRSGYFPFAPGLTARDYVSQAGGVGPGATDVFLMEAGSNQLIADASRVLEPGDAVFVSRTPTADTPDTAQLQFQQEQAEREVRRDLRQARYQLVSTVISAVATVASILIALSTLN